MQPVPLLLTLLASTLGAPGPQGGDPNDEVEVLVNGPVSTNEGGGDYDYGDYSDYGGGGFFGGGFPSLFGRGLGVPRVRVLVVPVEEVQGEAGPPPSIGDFLTALLGGPREEEVEERAECGAMCTLLTELFEGHLQGARDHLDAARAAADEARDRQNEVDFDEEEEAAGGDDGFDINNSTHTTKVLEDGSLVHINKTTISDTDENGNTFFFHKSVIHTISDAEDAGDETEETEEEEPAKESEELETVSDDGVDDGLRA